MRSREFLSIPGSPSSYAAYQISIAIVCGYDDWEGILNGMKKALGEAPDGQTAREKSSEGCAWKALRREASLYEGMHLRPNPATHDTPAATPVIVTELTSLNLVLLTEITALQRSASKHSPR